jgi:hypothetical protein
MLVVKTSIGKSDIHGIGLFADQFIPKGTVVWEFDKQFDIFFTSTEVEYMSDLQKELIKHFAYFSPQSSKYVYSIDNTRFINHSINPNIADEITYVSSNEEFPCIAIRDINIGEEITVDYRSIDFVDKYSNEKYLKEENKN